MVSLGPWAEARAARLAVAAVAAAVPRNVLRFSSDMIAPFCFVSRDWIRPVRRRGGSSRPQSRGPVRPGQPGTTRFYGVRQPTPCGSSLDFQELLENPCRIGALAPIL